MKSSAENDRSNLQHSLIDQGLEVCEFSLYTNGTWLGVMIRAMSRTMTLATPLTGSHRALFYLSRIPALSPSCSFGRNSTKRRFISPFTA
jgi:hypothetical protein